MFVPPHRGGMEINMNSEEKNIAAETDAATEQKTEKKKLDSEKLFPKRMEKVQSFYLLLVIMCTIGLGVAIFCAVTQDLMWAAVIAAVSIFFYVRFTGYTLDEQLGVSYKTASGSLTVTRCRARYGDIFYIPSRLLWYDVEAVSDKAFFSPKAKNAELHTIYIPKSIKHIGKDVFSSCESLTTVCFEGSRAEWEKVTKETDFSGFKMEFCAPFPTITKKK